MTVYETDVPGVGKKFEVDVGGGARAVVLLHHDGRVELFRRPDADADSQKVFELTSQQANYLGSILEGAYFETVDMDRLSVPLGDAIIEWVDITDASPVAGRTLAEADLRAVSGVSVIAVQRGPDTVPNPGPDFRVEPGDILVTLGTREQQSVFADRCQGGDATIDGMDDGAGADGTDGA
ncbi:cation:proton antiporter regulatory subunit [Haloglomus salinum]|jgi:TrkA domain protein|uniref:cation:proton antiporter regulatory subunit n=1 Tax=Haloglomus salinum TaxID=2962673 RepID=UPI0020C95F87|nr:TrkA C-terminal domain-containing protein [Haloglomus salinum]